VKEIVFNLRWIGLLLLALACLSLTGCGTTRADQVNASERPWNSPTSWQQGGAMGGIMDQQH
jgi:outer membrane biogenesis lipoprotein LolB